MDKRVTHTPGLIQPLVLMYHRHKEWARRSGFTPMEWQDFKRDRLANPPSRRAAERAALSKASA